MISKSTKQVPVASPTPKTAVMVVEAVDHPTAETNLLRSEATENEEGASREIVLDDFGGAEVSQDGLSVMFDGTRVDTRA